MAAAAAVMVHHGPLLPERLELLELSAQIPHVSVASCSSYLKALAVTLANVADMHTTAMHTNSFLTIVVFITHYTHHCCIR